MSENKDRFRTPRQQSGLEQWAEEQGLGGSMIRIRSYAHLARVLYANGLIDKSAAVQTFTEAVEFLHRKLNKLRRRSGVDLREAIERFEAELLQATEALDEANGLPDDRLEHMELDHP